MKIFYENVSGNSIITGKENYLKCVFIGDDGIMFEDFFNGGWSCRYRAENSSVELNTCKSS